MNSRILVYVLLACFLSLMFDEVQVNFAEASAVEQISVSKSPPPLQLTTRVIGKTYCVGDSELDGVRLNVLFNFTNVGKQKLLLYKGSDLVSRIKISRNLEDMTAKRFEVDSSVTHLTAEGSKCFKGLAPSKCFVIIRPGASYQARGVVGVFAVRDDTEQIAGGIPSGEHVVQVEVAIWPESLALATKLRDLWKPHGWLWFEPVTSKPVKVTIDKQRKVVDCR